MMGFCKAYSRLKAKYNPISFICRRDIVTLMENVITTDMSTRTENVWVVIQVKAVEDGVKLMVCVNFEIFERFFFIISIFKT